MRLMTWNCRGLDTPGKWQQLLDYGTAKSIDMMFMQEGTSAFDDAAAGIHSYGEKHKTAASNELAFGQVPIGGSANHLELKWKALRAAFGRNSFAGISGDGADKRYSVIVKGAGGDPAPTIPDYATNAGISDFLTAPIDRILSEIDDYAVPPAGGAGAIGAPVQGIKRKRNNNVFKLTEKRGGNFQIQADRGAIDTHIKNPVAMRISLLPRRRPRKTTIQANGGMVDAYFWHAPLGNAPLETYGITGYSTCKGHASGGDLALIVNIMFANYLGIENAFPDNTILLGDLNIDRTAARFIYKTDNTIGGLDPWCHVIASPTLNLTPQFRTDVVKVGAEYRLARENLLLSDHAPIIVDV